MKIEKTLLEDHCVQLSVAVDQETFDESKRKAARKLARKQKIPGFRPGNAPYHIILRHFGESTIIEEALETLVEDIYPRLIETEDIRPYGPGELKEVKSLTPPELEFVIPLAPEVKLSDYHAIRLEYQAPSITDEDVDRTVESLRSRRAKTDEVDRPAQAGDMMVITLHGHDAEAGEDAPLLVDLHDTPLVVEPDDGDFSSEWPYPGFSNSLKGLAKGAEAEFNHEYADDDDRDINLTGKKVRFHVWVNEVRSRDLPMMDDEFARTLGEYGDLAALREDARKHLESDARESYESEYENRLLDQIVEASEFSFPPQMVEDEVDALVENFKSRVSNEGWDFEAYLNANQKDLAALREEFRVTAIRRIRRGLVMMEVAEMEGIRISEREVQSEVQRTVDVLSASIPPKERKKILTEDFVRGLVSRAMRDALTSRTFARLKSIAKGEGDLETEPPVDAEPLEENPGAPDSPGEA